ncbi:MAG: hypothetical protein AAF909_12790, partial [Pseudomonadota bacterium]
MDGAIVTGIAGVWAGVSLGGALVAAPAKFRAPSLTRPVALEVGRAQFAWVGATEAALAAGLLGAMFLQSAPVWPGALLAIALFAAQRLGVMPFLDARTRQIIAGGGPPPSRLHQMFVLLEIAKFFLLACLALGLAPLS